MRLPIRAGGDAGRRGILRLRMAVLGFMALVWCVAASATTYYASSSSGNDANSGTSSASAWQTLAKVNAQTLAPGDSVLLRRGDSWNESLIPSASGSAISKISFDAYGAGAPPTLTGYYAMPSSGWVVVSGNAWKAPLPTTFTTVNFCLFGSVWGQKVAVGTANLKGQWDFYIANGYLYVYAVGNPSTFYASVVPMALSNVPVINVNGKSWLSFQHILVNWFDQYGVYVQGASDHLVFANMESDSMIPQGTQPLGFYVNASVPPVDVKILNSEAHMNYDGFRFDEAAAAITLMNDKAYANRNGALVDNTGAVVYSHCHFYGSSLAVAGSTDVVWTSGDGPVAGDGNIAGDTAPAVQVWQRYPARVTLNVDDPGMTPGADAYYESTVLPIADAAGVPVGVAITVGYPLAQTLIPEFQSWVNAGRDVTSHSMSHTYYTNLDAMEIRYTGAGSAARMSISNKVLTISVTGTSDSVTFNLGQGQAQGTLYQLEQALLATGKFSVSENPVCQGPYGLSRSFYLSQAPFQQSRRALIDEQYRGADLDSSIWNVNDPASVLGVGAEALQVGGGTGQDGATTVRFIEQIELGGALELQHGEVSFSAASRGVIGGLYAGGITSLSCVAGFQITPSGAGSTIQALINGTASGPVITTTAGHRYLLTTYVYSREVYRSGETYYSSAHPAGAGRGGEVIPADVRIVLEVQEINPSDIASLLAPATVLFDDVIVNAPGFCSYALVNATDMQCSVTSTYASHIAAAEVRTALPDSNYKTVLVESLVDGGQCYIASSASLDFYPQYVPPLNALIVASYRGYGRAIAEVADDQAIAQITTDGDNGVRGLVTMLKVPAARTQADCENAAFALIDDLGSKRWAGTYKAWSDFLPGGVRDTFPGDVVVVNVPSRDAQFQAVVRSVQIDYRDPANDRGVYSVEFANDAAAAISLVTEASATAVPLQDLPVRLGTTQAGSYYPANLVNAQVTEVTSTTVQVDAGISPGSGSGLEVRTRDFGWGSSNDRTFLGRFSARTFTLPRLGRTQTYFLRLYDSSSPTRYSRYAAVLHVDYPLGYAL